MWILIEIHLWLCTSCKWIFLLRAVKCKYEQTGPWPYNGTKQKRIQRTNWQKVGKKQKKAAQSNDQNWINIQAEYVVSKCLHNVNSFIGNIVIFGKVHEHYYFNLADHFRLVWISHYIRQIIIAWQWHIIECQITITFFCAKCVRSSSFLFVCVRSVATAIMTDKHWNPFSH